MALITQYVGHSIGFTPGSLVPQMPTLTPLLTEVHNNDMNIVNGVDVDSCDMTKITYSIVAYP